MTKGYQGVKNVRFSENLACFAFLLPPFWDSPFCHITDDLTKTTLYLNIYTSKENFHLLQSLLIIRPVGMRYLTEQMFNVHWQQIIFPN